MKEVKMEDSEIVLSYIGTSIVLQYDYDTQLLNITGDVGNVNGDINNVNGNVNNDVKGSVKGDVCGCFC